MARRLHELKTWPAVFELVWHGIKTFEIRKNDRDFKRGDALRLREYDTIDNIYSGSFIDAIVHSISKPEDWIPGCPPGFVVMSIEVAGKHRDGDDTGVEA
jgi:hypothetical protein